MKKRTFELETQTANGSLQCFLSDLKFDSWFFYVLESSRLIKNTCQAKLKSFCAPKTVANSCLVATYLEGSLFEVNTNSE